MASGPAQSISTAIKAAELILRAVTGRTRCTRCHRMLTARESVRVGMGPVCRREVAA